MSGPLADDATSTDVHARPNLSRRRWLAEFAAFLGTAIAGGWRGRRLGAAEPSAVPNATRAYEYLTTICDLGPRISGTDGMARQQALMEQHFEALGASVRYQPFEAVHPQTGSPVRLNNMVVSWHPQAAERVLLACHYDTRPHPDRELLPSNRAKPFIGANDGASGVALFMELGHHMAAARPRFGVDFVFFDGEELVYRAGDKYFLGSEFFAQQYRDEPPPYRYRAGVLVDMVADRDLKLYQEKNSLKLAPDVTRSVWRAAEELGVREFVARPKHTVLDDHLALNQIARIPTCDVIDFDYPYWHTRNDVPASCSGQSLSQVARVLLQWLNDYGRP